MHRQRGREMLQDRGAQREWVVEGPGPSGMGDKGSISGWLIGNSFVILHEFYDGNGFEIYQPVNEENSLTALVAGLNKLAPSMHGGPS